MEHLYLSPGFDVERVSFPSAGVGEIPEHGTDLGGCVNGHCLQ